jgi:hypothetical protein
MPRLGVLFISLALAVAFLASPVIEDASLAKPGARQTAAVYYEGTRLQTIRDVEHRLIAAHAVALSATHPDRNGLMIKAVEHDADRGTAVGVILDNAHPSNVSLVDELKRHHINAQLSLLPVDLVAIQVDGHSYLSERDWNDSPDEGVVSDPEHRDYYLIQHGMEGVAGHNDHLWTRKADALRIAGLTLLQYKAHEVIMSTAAIDRGTSAFDGLVDRAGRGDIVRLVVGGSPATWSSDQRAALAELRHRNVQIHYSPSRVPNIIVDGKCLWYSTFSATQSEPNRSGWAVALCEQLFAAQLGSRFEDFWDGGAVL